jgi:acetate kinase
MNVLVLNAGSSSLKFQLIATEKAGEERVLARGKRERLEGEGAHAKAIEGVLAELNGVTIEAVGHRVVHGGTHFSDAALITAETRAAIEACVPLAPLHNPANLAGIDAAQDALPDVPHVAVFDTAFHAGLPRRARMYGIDPEWAAEHGVQRYGFHGSSHAFVAKQAARFLERPLDELRLITCHLGNGASAAAIECGHSVDTTMGMTPLEGLVMGTRCGDIDPGALLHLLSSGAITVEALDRKLNKESGLLGLSGHSNDLRDLESRAAEGDERARLAMTVFAHRVRKAIGSYAAVMGGVDAVVLCGGIGENSAQMRRRILQRFDWMGLILDDDSNQQAAVGPSSRVACVSENHARVKALVIATDEEQMIAEEAARIAEGRADVKSAAPIPIAVSARHVHLDRETMDVLFGPGSELTVYKPLSQPGQYASEQKVNLVGPRGRIDGVRILGPLRRGNQVEISRTDEYKLGVDAPVRMSGHVEGSAPITLEGPEGTVHLHEGLICAWRHIHMTPADAAAYGVENGDAVEVEVDGGPRDLIFGDVIVRVSEKFATEMHIDTDEANAAELAPQGEGMLVDIPDAKVALRKRRAAI